MLRWMGQRRKEPTDGATPQQDKMASKMAAGDDATKEKLAARKNSKFAMKRSVYLPRVVLKAGGDTSSNGKPDRMKNVDHLPEVVDQNSDQNQGFSKEFNEPAEDAWSENFYLRSDKRFRGINPLYVDTYKIRRSSRQSTPSGEKSSSSGYGGSNLYSSSSDHPEQDQLYTEMKTKIDGVLEQNPNYVKSIQVAKRKNKSTHSSGTSSGTLSTIPEGKIDFTIPRPIWPQFAGRNPNINQRTSTSNQEYDSLVDEAVLLYTSLSNHQGQIMQNGDQHMNPHRSESIKSEFSVKDVLLELLNHVNATIEGKGVLTPEEMLKRVNERISDSIDALKNATEEEMRMLCINLRNSKKVDSVVRAFSHSSSSGNSSQSSPEWNAHRLRGPSRSSSMETEDIYHLPSSSSSGFSDCMFNKDGMTVINNQHPQLLNHLTSGLPSGPLPMFVHDDLASVPNGVRNAMIYGTLCRNGSAHVHAHALRGSKMTASVTDVNSACGASGIDINAVDVISDSCGGENVCARSDGLKKSLLKVDDDKPSVWEQYYGVNGVKMRMEVMETDKDGGDVKIDLNYVPKPTDVPIFPGGRPEADFTLDVPRSEMLSKRMKEDKKWRCRCRLLTSFLGLVFFLLSVMAVSLMLTKGRKMFGSMA